MSLFTDLSSLLAVLKATPFSIKDAYLAFLKVANDIGQFIGPSGPVFAAAPGQDCSKIANDCCAVILANPATHAANAGPVGKLGDGTILKLILQFLQLFGPFLKPAPAPTP